MTNNKIGFIIVVTIISLIVARLIYLSFAVPETDTIPFVAYQPPIIIIQGV